MLISTSSAAFPGLWLAHDGLSEEFDYSRGLRFPGRFRVTPAE